MDASKDQGAARSPHISKREEALVAEALKLGASGPDEITYATAAKTRAGRALIKAIENISGRPRLLRMALDYQREMEAGKSFWEVMVERYDVKLDLPGAGLANIPREGPLVVVANHPFGILDGLTFGHIMAQTRRDFKILANSVFVKAPEVEPHILPIDFAETREALQVNLATRKQALSYLKGGGCVGIFPGGTVSTGARFFSEAYDPSWKTFTAKLVQGSGAAVVPIFFEGRNSRLFQVASHVSDTLRLALLIHEFDNQLRRPVRVVIGSPLPRAVIDRFKGDPKGLMAFLRSHTYSLSPDPVSRRQIGKEWG